MGCSPWGHIELDTTSRESLSRECYQGGCTCSQFLDVEVRGELAKQASGDLSSRTTWPSHRGDLFRSLLCTPFGGLVPHLITQDRQPEVPWPGPQRRMQGWG